MNKNMLRFIVVLSCLSILSTFGVPTFPAKGANLNNLSEDSLPVGFLYASEGVNHSQSCIIAGVAEDPDDRARIVDVRVFIDGEYLLTAPADIFIDWYDPTYCADATCLFYADVWSQVTPNVAHVISIQAYDLETDQWVDLPGLEQPMTCVNYDIYTYNLRTGQTERITTQETTGEYNPSWSPNGKFLVHHLAYGEWTDLFVTNVDTHESVLLQGAEGGINPAWSPNGQWILFDDAALSEPSNVYRIKPEGGTPEWIHSDAINADWSPNSSMVVYQRYSDGSLQTAAVVGGSENQIAEQGAAPEWSPNGQWIAFELEGDIWKVGVNMSGVLQGEPIQLTSGTAWDEKPTWLNDSKSIVFVSCPDEDFDMCDLWKIPADGGQPEWLTGVGPYGDYNPEVSNNGEYVAWARVQVP